MAFLGSECPFLLLGKLSWCSKLWVILCWGSVAPKSVHGLIDSSLPPKLMTFPHTSHSTVARLVAVQDQCVHTFSSYITGGTVVWGRKGKEGVEGWLGKANTFIQKVDFSWNAYIYMLVHAFGFSIWSTIINQHLKSIFKSWELQLASYHHFLFL